ncbi:MAG: YceI family protein, partial [Bacteroidetes bacterium]|nr:YceI family protein [Bacteroidota bacterium]
LIMLTLFVVSITFAQGFKVKATGEQNFSFTDEHGRNQAMFFSSTPLEDVTGLSNDVKGTITFDVSDVSTLKGSISISTASLKTGIELRDGHLQSANWLDAESYPEITFVIKNVSNVKSLEDNKLEAKVTGDFTAHGVTKEVIADVTMTYLDESEQTKKKAPGDLLGVVAKFSIVLSDYEVEHMVVGQKVADSIEITVTMVGSNAK